MNHETLQALYALDVAEVGEGEAAKRWEYWSGTYWRYNERFPGIIVKPSWCEDMQYRRKPGIHWPKVMQPDTKPEWPADAPAWANYMATDLDGECTWFKDKPKPIEIEGCNFWRRDGRNEMNETACPNWRDSLIERPKPVLKKIDWSKARNNILIHTPLIPGEKVTSDWIAWNCDENTRGNPLPDGLVVEWYAKILDHLYTNAAPIWDRVTRFRIVGIQEGWE